MKKILVLGFILGFAYISFVPPDGMRKFPIANINFQLEDNKATFSLGASEPKAAPSEKTE